ncbi:unnamed protein product [Tilletia controversa]|nr:unnamed protein product [Tilletia controversa]
MLRAVGAWRSAPRPAPDDSALLRAVGAWRSTLPPAPDDAARKPLTVASAPDHSVAPPSRISRRVYKTKQIEVRHNALRPSDSFKRYVREHAEILAPFLAVQQGALDALANNDPELRSLLTDAEAHIRLRARPGVIGGYVPYERDAREQLNIIQLLAPTMGGAHASAGTQSGFRRQ